MADGGSSEGPATDRHNDPVIDPSKNVLDLVAADARRQDDLRKVTTEHAREMAEKESSHIRELMQLRADFAREIRLAETARIDAIRAVDVGAVSRAAEVAATQATTLASQVATSAETLRTQVQAADAAGRANLITALEPIQKDIADLRRVQYEQAGQKAGTVEQRDAASEIRVDRRGSIGTVLGVAGGLFGLFTLILAIVVIFLR